VSEALVEGRDLDAKYQVIANAANKASISDSRITVWPVFYGLVNEASVGQTTGTMH